MFFEYAVKCTTELQNRVQLSLKAGRRKTIEVDCVIRLGEQNLKDLKKPYPRIKSNGSTELVHLRLEFFNCLVYQGGNTWYTWPNYILKMLKDNSSVNFYPKIRGISQQFEHITLERSFARYSEPILLAKCP